MIVVAETVQEQSEESQVTDSEMRLQRAGEMTNKVEDRNLANDAIYVDWQWREHGQDTKLAISENESLTALVKLQAVSSAFDITTADSEKLESWISAKALDAKVSDEELSLLRKTQNVDYTNIRYFEPIDRNREREARQVKAVTVRGETYDKNAEFGMDVFDALARHEKEQIEKLDFSKAREMAVQMDAAKIWLADREKEFAKDPDRESKIRLTEDAPMRDEAVRVTVNKGDLSPRAMAEIRAQAYTLKLTKEDEMRIDRWLEDKGKDQGLKAGQLDKLVKSFDPLYEDIRAHERPDKAYDERASKVTEVVAQGTSYSKNSNGLIDGFRSLAKEEQAQLWKLDFDKAEEVTVKMEALALWIADKDKARTRLPEKEPSLSKDIGSGSVLRSQLREKGKSPAKDTKSDLEKDISKDDLI